MIDDLDKVVQILRGTPLESHPIERLSVPGHPSPAFAIDPLKRDVQEVWRLLLDKAEELGRWPIVALCYAGAGEDWRQDVQAEDFFSRRPYRQEGGRSWPLRSPQDLIAASADVDLEVALERQAEQLDGRSLDEAAEQELALLVHQQGKAPDHDQLRDLIESAQITNLAQLHRWLLDWQAAQLKPSWWRSLLVGARYLDQWGMVDYIRPTLLLLPTTESWTVPAFHAFWGAGRFTTPATLALLRRWHDRWGAELVAHFGTVLIFRVARPPRTLEEALPLAWEQVTLAECTTTLSGISTLYHARVLVDRGEWALHERP